MAETLINPSSFRISIVTATLELPAFAQLPTCLCLIVFLCCEYRELVPRPCVPRQAINTASHATGGYIYISHSILIAGVTPGMAQAQNWASPTVPDHNNDPPGNTGSSSSPTQVDNTEDAKVKLRSLPPWIITPDPTDRQHRPQPPPRPQTPVLPHHQYLPEAQRGRTARGRRWDHLRNAEPAMLDQTVEQSSARWLTFMVSGPQYSQHEVEGAELMSDEWMEENVPFWTGDQDLADEHNEREKHRSFLMDMARRSGSVNRAKVSVSILWCWEHRSRILTLPAEHNLEEPVRSTFIQNYHGGFHPSCIGPWCKGLRRDQVGGSGELSPACFHIHNTYRRLRCDPLYRVHHLG